MATRRASGYYADPALAAVGESLGEAIFGDPEKVGQTQLRAAQTALAGERARGARRENEAVVAMSVGVRRGLVPNGFRPADDRPGAAGYTQNDLHADAILAGDATMRAVPGLNRSLVYANPGSFNEGQRTAASLGAGDNFQGTREGFEGQQATARRGQDIAAGSSRYATDQARAGALEREDLQERGRNNRATITLAPNTDTLVSPNHPVVRGLPRQYQGGGEGVQNGGAAPGLVPRGEADQLFTLPQPPATARRVGRAATPMTDDQLAGVAPSPGNSLVPPSAQASDGPIRLRGRDRPENLSQAQAQLIKELSDPRGVSPEREAQILRLLPAGTIAGQEARLAAADKRSAEDRASRESVAAGAQAGANSRAAAAQEGANSRAAAAQEGANARAVGAQDGANTRAAAAQAGANARTQMRIDGAAPARPSLVTPQMSQGFQQELGLELDARQIRFTPEAQRHVISRAQQLFSDPASPQHRQTAPALREAINEIMNAPDVEAARSDSWFNRTKEYGIPQSILQGQPAPATTAPLPAGASRTGNGEQRLTPAQTDTPAPNDQTAATLRAAQAAIAAGANREAVIQRLRNMGIDPAGIQ